MLKLHKLPYSRFQELVDEDIFPAAIGDELLAFQIQKKEGNLFIAYFDMDKFGTVNTETNVTYRELQLPVEVETIGRLRLECSNAFAVPVTYKDPQTKKIVNQLLHVKDYLPGQETLITFDNLNLTDHYELEINEKSFKVTPATGTVLKISDSDKLGEICDSAVEAINKNPEIHLQFAFELQMPFSILGGIDNLFFAYMDLAKGHRTAFVIDRNTGEAKLLSQLFAPLNLERKSIAICGHNSDGFFVLFGHQDGERSGSIMFVTYDELRNWKITDGSLTTEAIVFRDEIYLLGEDGYFINDATGDIVGRLNEDELLVAVSPNLPFILIG